MGSRFANINSPVWRRRRTTTTNWLGRLGPMESFETRCRGDPTSSPETWLRTRHDPTARPTPSCLALMLGLPSTHSFEGPALVLPASNGGLHSFLATAIPDLGLRLKLKSNGMSGSPCSPPSPWEMSWVTPRARLFG